MKDHRTEKYFLLALLIAASVVSFFILKPFLFPLILALVFRTAFAPVHGRIRSGISSRAFAALLSTAFVLCVVIAPLALLTTQIFREATDVYTYLATPQGSAMFSRGLQNVVLALNDFIPGASEISFSVNEYTGRALNWFVSHLSVLLSNVASAVLSLFIFLISLYYLFKESDNLYERVIALSPLRNSYDAEILTKLSLAVNSVVRGNLAVALIQGSVTALGFFIFGVPHPALWGSVAAVAALIPGFGTALVIGPAVLYLLARGNTGSGVGLLVWGMIAVGLIDNVLGPMFVKRGINIHPFLILLSILGGLALFGPIGFLLGPLTLSFLYALLDTYGSMTKKEAIIE